MKNNIFHMKNGIFHMKNNIFHYFSYEKYHFSHEKQIRRSTTLLREKFQKNRLFYPKRSTKPIC